MIKSPFLLISFFAILLSQNVQDIIYVKYFESDFNFKSDLSMLSTDRRGKAHLAVSYNTLNQPIKIEHFSSNGVTQKLEMLKYDEEGKNPNDILGFRKDVDEKVFKNFSKEIMSGGATILGGCCNVSPLHINELKLLKN